MPAVQFGSYLGPLLFMGGFFLQAIAGFGYNLALVGIILFALTVVFTLVTLPVEFDATKRAKKELVAMNILTGEEMVGVNKTLDAAALTYVAAAIAALGQLLYYASILGRSRD